MTEREGRDEIPAASDWLLESLVRLVNHLERQGVRMNIPITLNIGGLLVSGFLMDGKEYFEQFAQIMEAGLPEFFGETKEQIANNFRELGGLYDPTGEGTPRAESPEDAPEASDVPLNFYFVHLKDAVFVHPGGAPIPSDQGVLWRCRLEAVDGFTLGSFAITPDE